MNAAHWHLILNHIPVVGTAFALALLGWAMFRHNDELKRAGLGAVAIVALLTIPAYMTGEPAFEAAMEVLEATPEDEDPLVKNHETAAGYAFAIVALAGVCAGFALFTSRRSRPLSSRLVLTTLIFTLIAVLSMGRVAQLGGLIRHPEIHAAPTK